MEIPLRNHRKGRTLVGARWVWLLFALSLGQAQSLIIPQIADGGGWQTTLVVGNTTSVPTTASIGFFQDIGSGATQNWSPPFIESGSTQNLALPAGGTIFLHTTGTAAATTAGWAQVQSAAGVVAYAIFTQQVPGRPNQDGTAAAAASGTRVLMPYDNTNSFVTSMAIANTTSASESISVGIQPTSGASSQPTPITLPANGHMAFTVPQQFSTTAGQSGMLEFYVSGGSFSILALRFNPTGSFTTAPVFPETGPPVIAPGSGTNVSGLWGGTFTGGRATGGAVASGVLILALSQTGSQVTGSFASPESLVSGNISGSVVAGTFDFQSLHYFDSSGCGTQWLSGAAQVTGTTMQGTWTAVNDVSAACGTLPPAPNTFPVQFSLNTAAEQFCGTYNNPGHDAGLVTFLVSSDGSFVGSSTPTNGVGTSTTFAGQVVGNTLTQTSVNQDGSPPGLIGSILNGVLSGTFATGDPSGAVGTFSASTTGCQ